MLAQRGTGWHWEPETSTERIHVPRLNVSYLHTVCENMWHQCDLSLVRHNTSALAMAHNTHDHPFYYLYALNSRYCFQFLIDLAFYPYFAFNSQYIALKASIRLHCIKTRKENKKHWIQFTWFHCNQWLYKKRYIWCENDSAHRLSQVRRLTIHSYDTKIQSNLRHNFLNCFSFIWFYNNWE